MSTTLVSGGRATPAGMSCTSPPATHGSRPSYHRCPLSTHDGSSRPMSPAEQTFSEATARARGDRGYPKPGERVIMGLRGAPITERMMNYAPVEDVDKAPDCAMLFIIAEKEEYFDNKDHAIKAHDRAKGPRKLVTIPRHHPLRDLRAGAPAGTEAGHRLVR